VPPPDFIASAGSTAGASASPTEVVRRTLVGSGVELVASCNIGAYDLRAPEVFRSTELMPGARGVVVAASAGPTLWKRFRAWIDAEPERLDQPHPYDAFISEILAQADAALRAAGIRFRRFDAAFHAPVRISFVALAELVGLGSAGPFGLVIHPKHGAWWALRGAWLVDADVDPPLEPDRPCVGCPAPCIGGWQNAGGVARATAEVRARCVIGQSSRYHPDQIAYHYDRAATVLRLKRALR
jgi:epoxyqueuosine reductase QueG